MGFCGDGVAATILSQHGFGRESVIETVKEKLAGFQAKAPAKPPKKAARSTAKTRARKRT